MIFQYKIAVKTRVSKIVKAFYFQEHERNKEHYAKEEKEIREENLRLQRRLQLEMERREALCRHLSESESRWVVLILSITSC